MDITAIAGVVRPGDTLIIGMHPDADPDMDFTALREALPDTPIVVILGAESMAIHRPSSSPKPPPSDTDWIQFTRGS